MFLFGYMLISELILPEICCFHLNMIGLIFHADTMLQNEKMILVKSNEKKLFLLTD